LTQHALSEAVSLGDKVIAVMVVFDVVEPGRPRTEIEEQWEIWNPGVPLQVLHTDYASIVRPIMGFVDELRAVPDQQVVVLIPWSFLSDSGIDYCTTRSTSHSRRRCTSAPMWSSPVFPCPCDHLIPNLSSSTARTIPKKSAPPDSSIDH
jgi:hypothetical protein